MWCFRSPLWKPSQNENIPDNFTHAFVVQKTGEKRTYGKDEIERRINLDEKPGFLLPQILALPSPKGSSLWEKYKTIKKNRDRIIHLKSIDKRHQAKRSKRYGV